ncbi:MAG: hypothetical protein ACOX9R_09710 [Armatimonadota bacterium]
MDQETMLHHLEELAERLGIKVRYEAAAGRVGLCSLRGSRVAVIDVNLRVPDRVAALASVLAAEEINGVYIPPEVRRRLEQSTPLRVRPGDPDDRQQSAVDCRDGSAEDEATADAPDLPTGASGSDAEKEDVRESGAGPEADADSFA